MASPRLTRPLERSAGRGGRAPDRSRTSQPPTSSSPTRLSRRSTRARFSRVLARCPPMPAMRPRFISSSTWEPRSRLHGGFPMVAGAARKPRAELFSPPLRGSSRPLRCKKARPFGSLASLGPGRVQATPWGAHHGTPSQRGAAPTMERAMKNIAEFTIIGRVGARKTLGKAVRVTIASNYRLKDERGEWREDTYWNEVTVFSPTTQAYIEEHIAKGDLVHVRGRLRQSSYERNGGRVYTVDLVASSFSRLAQGSDRVKASEPSREAQPA